ncbi:hypothetical protein MHPYR_520051 [uncultured Mycobacterium sp.]|uniref:Uncharacterized protein n=1 Tax=uncultured Mycobacterium sp. TaxID=171292 RepID=A0A1Y5PHS9_9MYCO|nr:hypothetical protein MHPYR_520051 [uncultured Mycobacterium sp.]
MTTPTDTIGTQLPQPDPRGWLVFDRLPAELQDAEDSTQDNDVRYHRESWHYRGPTYHRAATAAERTLLEHLGYVLPDDLRTRVQFVTDNVRNRRWPALELQNPTTGGE